MAHENSIINQKNAAVTINNEDKQYYPNSTFRQEIEERVDRQRIPLHYFGAGNINGDAPIHWQHADIVHTGDLVVSRSYPYIDRSAGASIQSWMKVLEATIKRFTSKTIFMYGHAAEGYDVTGKRDDLDAFHDYLGNVLKLVGSAIKTGKTIDEILTTTEIPGS